MQQTQPITLKSLLAIQSLFEKPLDTHIWMGHQAFTYMKKKFAANADFDQRDHRSLAAMQVISSEMMPDWDVEIGRVVIRDGQRERVISKRFTLNEGR